MNLTERQTMLMTFIVDGYKTAHDIWLHSWLHSWYTNLSPTAVRRTLKQLMDKGLVTRERVGREYVYRVVLGDGS